MPGGIRMCVNATRQQLNSVNTPRSIAADSDLWLIGSTPLTRNALCRSHQPVRRLKAGLIA
jgi:hypothetical protein